ncbi:hypothetical protein NFI96_011459, partial [Prochilodus magdalenae]
YRKSTISFLNQSLFTQFPFQVPRSLSPELSQAFPLDMDRSYLVCLIVFLQFWSCPAAPSTPPPLAPSSTPQGEVECPSSCVLLVYNNESMSENGLVMTSKELNPDYYEARRAGNVAQHYINTLYGSPFSLYSVTRVHKARTEDMAEAGMKYILEFSVKDWVGESSEVQSSVEVLYPRGETQRPPQVQGSLEGLPHLNTSAKEEEFYQRYSVPGSAVSAKDIPDSYGNTDPEMKPFWNLAWAASSFVMLNESNENTLYNMAQVAKIKQLETLDDQLSFEYEILLHDMVSQEIIRWKLLVSWSPAGGVKVLETELLPRCHCKSPTQ